MRPFPPSALRGQGVAREHKVKGVTTHVIADTNGHPLGALCTAAHIDERKQVPQLLKALDPWKTEGMILKADRGYTSKCLQEQILRRGIYPAIRQRGRHEIGRAPGVSIRWKIERAFSNFKQCFKRFGHRWEKKQKARQSIVFLALIAYWSEILVG